jgi:hypothetical protein
VVRADYAAQCPHLLVLRSNLAKQSSPTRV